MRASASASMRKRQRVPVWDLVHGVFVCTTKEERAYEYIPQEAKIRVYDGWKQRETRGVLVNDLFSPNLDLFHL